MANALRTARSPVGRALSSGLLAAACAGVAAGCGGGGGAHSAGSGKTPDQQFLPAPSGGCPSFQESDQRCRRDDVSLICDFAPDGVEPSRPVRIWMSDAARQDIAPLVFFWHGLALSAGSAVEASWGLGEAVVQEMVDAGAIVAAPEADAERAMNAGFTMLPWFQALGSGENDDLLVMDEVVACADRKVGIDYSRIHSSGMSAGGLQTGQVAARRSGYLASVAVFSGGQIGSPSPQDPNNDYPAALFHGGSADMVGLNFQTQQGMYHDGLVEDGHFAILCNHEGAHSVPPEAAQAAWQFLQDHPYGVDPSPYADMLPEPMASFCTK